MGEYQEHSYDEAWERAKAHRTIANETPYAQNWSRELAEKWVRDIPEFPEIGTPETPILEFDLTSENLGKILVKDESRLEINPTGTMKDRMARSCANLYLYAAKYHLELSKTEPGYEQRIPQMHLPRYSLLTSGNAGLALARAFAQFDLPPPKLLLDSHTPGEMIEKLKINRADVYLADLSTNPFSGRSSKEEPMNTWQIKDITNNTGGSDLTSAGGANMEVEVPAIFYHKMIRDSFKRNPDEIYTPYGSGVLHSEFLVAQFLTWLSKETGASTEGFTPDEVNLIKNIEKIKIFGAEPKDSNSIANKLTAAAKPFAEYFEEKLRSYRKRGSTSPESGVGKVSETEIKKAHMLMKKYGEPMGLRSEPSAAAGFALYIKRKRAGLVPVNTKVLVINTGCGIISEA